MNENGIYAAVKDGRRVHAFFIDQESVEINSLNRRSCANRQKKERALAEEQTVQAEQLKAAEKERNALESRKRKLLRFITRTIKHEAILAAAMGLMYAGVHYGLVSLFFAVPVMNVLFALFCFKAGIFCDRLYRYRR